MLTKCKAFVTETKFKAEMKCSFLRITVTVAIDEQLNKLAVIKIAKTKTAIWQNFFILWLKGQKNRLCQRIPKPLLPFVMSQSVHQSLNAYESIHKRTFLWDFFERPSTQQRFLYASYLMSSSCMTFVIFCEEDCEFFLRASTVDKNAVISKWSFRWALIPASQRSWNTSSCSSIAA